MEADQIYTILTYREEKLLDRSRWYGTLQGARTTAFDLLDGLKDATRVRIVDQDGKQVWERFQDA